MNLYISSYEYSEFDVPRKIVQYKKTKLDNRSVLVVEIDRPLIGQKYGLLDKNVTKLYLLNRVDENAFNLLSNFPIDVHILITKNYEMTEPSSLSELQNVAWACLYNNEKDAIEHTIGLI